MAKKMYAIQENGQVTLPVDFRKKHNLKKGDLIVFRETDEGLLLDVKETLALSMLDQIEAALENQGISLDDLLASEQEIRQEAVKSE